jgi:hypothetical protein
MNYKYGKMWKEVVVAQFKVFYHHMSGGNRVEPHNIAFNTGVQNLNPGPLNRKQAY